MTASKKMTSGWHTFAAHVISVFFKITHSSFALLGLAMAFVAIVLIARPDLQQEGEDQLMDWLEARQMALLDASDMEPEPEPSGRAMAVNLKSLPKQQAKVAYWLSKKYRVAPEPLGLLVAEAYQTGTRVKLDPTLILAVMAVESNFNPFAQSPVGAQGLMQVMTRVHTDKYEDVGGQLAAFDPVTNLRVGVKVLMECITRAGSVEGGLRFYVGAGNLTDDGGYATKVLAEYSRLRKIAGGRPVAMALPLLAANAPQAAPASAVIAPPAATPPVATGADKVALLSDL